MTNTIQFFGTFRAVMPVVNGNFQGIKLSYLNRKNEVKESPSFGNTYLASHPEITTVIRELKEGDSISMDIGKNEKGFNTIYSVKKIDKIPELVHKTNSFSGKTFKKDPLAVVGQIKGNIVTNSVTLAIANANNVKVTQTDLRAAAMLVIDLHKDLEAMDIASLIGLKTEQSSPSPEVLARANLDAVLNPIQKSFI